jgi:hypothetical protein
MEGGRNVEGDEIVALVRKYVENPDRRVSAALDILDLISKEKKAAAMKFGLLLLKHMRAEGMNVPADADELLQRWGNEQ